MNRIFLTFILLFISLICFSQEIDSLKNTEWLLYAEGYGNGGHYSINGELSRKRIKIQTGDRFGLAFMVQNHESGVYSHSFSTNYLSIVYEKNVVFGYKLIRPEIGMGGTLFLLDGIYGSLNKDYILNWNDMTFWLVPRVGIRIVNKRDFFARVAYTPAIFITELNELRSTKFDSRFGISLGFAINSLYR